MLPGTSSKSIGAQVANPSMSSGDVQEFVKLARSITGIAISAEKSDFLMSRLGRRLTATGQADFGEYRKYLLAHHTERALFAEALTTHTTSFFRERAQYDWLASTGLHELSDKAAGREAVIWSAACSTGQEGYSALMIVQMARQAGAWNLRARLIGTDLSRPVVQVAAKAVYSQEQITEIPAELRRRFLLSAKAQDGRYRMIPELRASAAWRVGNLVTGEGLEGISADVVFLRNVLIYFDEETRHRVVENVYRRLRVGGYLLVGHTEAALTRRDGLEPVRPSILRKVE